MSSMTLEKPTCYSALSSIGFHIIFITMAGAFMMSRVAPSPPPPKKIFQLKMVHKTPPPVVKRERIQEKTVKKLAEIIPVKPHFIPQPQMKQQPMQVADIQRVVPNIAPMKSPMSSARQPVVAARKFITQSSKVVSISHYVASGPRTFGGLGGSGNVGGGLGGSGKVAKVAMLQKSVAKIKFPLGAPRPVPTIVDQGVLRGYLVQVRRKIDSAKIYPMMARNAGYEGKVRVQFTIMKNGRVEGLTLITKTPYPMLNKEALEMVKRAAPFSIFPDEVGEQFLEVVLPFSFYLN